MFDVGFWELIILFGLGLIILGPERLPKVAMQVGNWIGQARRMARQLSSQIRDEIDIKEPFSPPTYSTEEKSYSRPGVDDLDPSAAGDDSPTEEADDASPDDADSTADSTR